MSEKNRELENRILGELLFGRLSFIPMERHGEMLQGFFEKNPPNGADIRKEIERGVEWIKERYSQRANQ